MYKLYNPSTGEFYQATKGFDFVFMDESSAYNLKDALDEGDVYRVVAFEDGREDD